MRLPTICALLAAALTTSAWAQRPVGPGSTAEGLRLLHRMQSALGGTQNLAAIRDMEETIRGDAWDSTGTALGTVWKRTRWIRTPNVIRLDQRGPRGTYVLFFDGRSGTGWEILPDMTGPDPYRTTGIAVALTGEELQFAKSYLSGFDVTLWLADQFPGFRVTSPRASVVRIEHAGIATDITIDSASGLPVKSAGVSLADPTRPVSSEMHYVGWTTLAGVRFPTSRVNYHEGVKRGEVTTESIQVNTGLHLDDLSAQPSDFQPDVTVR